MKFDWRGYTKRVRENLNVVRVCTIWLLPQGLYMKLKSNKDFFQHNFIVQKTWNNMNWHLHKNYSLYFTWNAFEALRWIVNQLELFNRFVCSQHFSGGATGQRTQLHGQCILRRDMSLLMCVQKCSQYFSG
jgi:hypothetical protein